MRSSMVYADACSDSVAAMFTTFKLQRLQGTAFRPAATRVGVGVCVCVCVVDDQVRRADFKDEISTLADSGRNGTPTVIGG